MVLGRKTIWKATARARRGWHWAMVGFAHNLAPLRAPSLNRNSPLGFYSEASGVHG